LLLLPSLPSSHVLSVQSTSASGRAQVKADLSLLCPQDTGWLQAKAGLKVLCLRGIGLAQVKADLKASVLADG
jgi:hypothetical protein